MILCEKTADSAPLAAAEAGCVREESPRPKRPRQALQDLSLPTGLLLEHVCTRSAKEKQHHLGEVVG